MTWRQSLNVLEGYQRRMRNEYERNVLLHRNIYTDIYNYIRKKEHHRTAEELYPTSMDKPVRTKSVHNMPVRDLKKIFEKTWQQKN